MTATLELEEVKHQPAVSDMKFYRYNQRIYASINEFDEVTSRQVRVECTEYDMLKETARGWWIGRSWSPESTKRWVSKTAKKRFAYPTKEQALTAFVARTKRYIEILEARADDAKQGLYEAERIAKKELIPVTINHQQETT